MQRPLGSPDREWGVVQFNPVLGDPAKEDASAGSPAEVGGRLLSCTERVPSSNWKGVKQCCHLVRPRPAPRGIGPSLAGPLRPILNPKAESQSSRAARTPSPLPTPNSTRVPKRPPPQSPRVASVIGGQGAPTPAFSTLRTRSTWLSPGGLSGWKGGLHAPKLQERIMHPWGIMRSRRDRAALRVSCTGNHASLGGITQPWEDPASAGIHEGLGWGAQPVDEVPRCMYWRPELYQGIVSLPAPVGLALASQGIWVDRGVAGVSMGGAWPPAAPDSRGSAQMPAAGRRAPGPPVHPPRRARDSACLPPGPSSLAPLLPLSAAPR